WLGKNDAEVCVVVFAFLNETELVTVSILHLRHAQRSVEIERNDARAREQIAKRDAIGRRQVRAFDRGVDLVVRDVDDTTILRARNRPLFVFLLTMKCGPESTIRFAVTEQRDLLRIRAGHAKRLEQ